MKVKSTTKKLNLSLTLLPFIFYLFSFYGCASIKEAARGFAGISTKALEESRKDAIRKTFNYNYSACYDKVKAALQETGSYIYAQSKNKRMIAVYVSESDTTPVGIFLKMTGRNKTQIEISSPSTYGKETVAKNVFSVLEGTYKPKAEKGQPDEKKETGY